MSVSLEGFEIPILLIIRILKDMSLAYSKDVPKDAMPNGYCVCINNRIKNPDALQRLD